MRTPPAEAWTTSALRHDLRHQLATVRALLAAAADADPVTEGRPDHPPGAAEQLVATAGVELEHAVTLADALPHSPEDHPPAGEAAREPVPCRLDALVRAAADAAAPARRRVQVETEPSLWTSLDRTSATRVVRNLVWNALAATSDGGVVLLRAVRAPDPAHSAVCFQVHDDGPGPGPDGFGRVGGAGLDLVRSLVLPAGGWLTLGRSWLGGACASVTLPAASAIPRQGR